MTYRIMRLKKYYDAFRSNNSLLKTSFNQKFKIFFNILRFFISNSKKSLIIKNKPVTAQIEPTSKCNLKCEMCIRKKIGVPIGTMSFENFKKVLDKVDSLFKIHLSGQGEPFLNPELFDMIKYANKKGITVYLTINGTILTKKIINKICKVDIGEIGISIDSTKKEKYEKIRKGANFEKVLSNIKNLTKELENKKKKTILCLTTVILKENINELLEFVRLAKKLGIKKIVFQTIQNKKDYVDKYNKKIKKQIISKFDSLERKIKETKKLADEYDITVIFDEEKSPGCIWPWRSIYVTWEGYVTPCCKILDYRKPFFGNILKEDFWKIWNGKKYQIFRKLLRKKKAPFPCKGCNMI